MFLFDGLKSKLNYLEESQIEQIHQAYLFAMEAHKGQKRDTGEPYFVHPIAVASILSVMHLDYQSIMASLLHDVVEDTGITKEAIEHTFGSVIAELVDGVTKLSQMEILDHAEAQAESFRKMVLAMSRDIRVILIKLADRLHNMQTLHSLPYKKRHRISKETLDIYAPVANRLGMHMFCIELEELSFSAFYPRRYRIICNSVEKIRTSYKVTVSMIEDELRQSMAKASLRDATVFAREKHLYSIYKRMKDHKASFVDATNMYAFRVIVNSVDECYRALGVVHSLYKPVPGKFVDYIAMPKFNGYQSLHTCLFGPHGVQIEVQIRTHTMDQIANYGIVTPWLYKMEDKTHGSPQVRTQRWISNLLEMQQNTDSSLEFIDNVKSDLFPDEIYVFTPKGNIVELPKGATVVDFAYMVHTDIGNSCVAAKIDHQFIPLSTILVSGQTVSIITMTEAKPNPSWLNFVITGRARGGIRNFLKNQKRSEAIDFGRLLLQKCISDLGVDFENISPQIINEFLASTHFETLDDLFEDIGLGNRIAVFVAHQLLSTIKGEPGTAFGDIDHEKIAPLLISDSEGMAIEFASCCCPIPRDPIFGYLQPGKGLTVHRDNCINVVKLRRNPEMHVPVSWADEVKGLFVASIDIDMMTNHRNSLASIVQAVVSAESSVDDIQIKERTSSHSFIVLKVMIKNRTHLERVLRYIENVSTVAGVKRSNS